MAQNNQPIKITFKIDRERLLEYSKLSAADRLQWLEEANNFLHSISDKIFQKRWELQRTGKI